MEIFKERRLVLLPIKYPSLWEIFKQQQAAQWTTEELDFSSDKDDWKLLASEEQDFLLNIIAFFASSDMIIVENLQDQFMSEVTLAECRAFYALQAFVETVHSETYAKMLQLFAPPERHEELCKLSQKNNSILGKIQWAEKFMASEEPFAVRLWAFCIYEGVLFSASFCAIYWLRERGLCPGLTTSNDFIARDEGLHALFAVEMIKMLPEIPKDRFYEVIREAVAKEKIFVEESLQNRLKGLNMDSMYQYVCYCADRLLKMIGLEKIFKVDNPFRWMEKISFDGKTNFFEKRVSEYNKPAVGLRSEENEYSEDMDF